LAGKVYLTHGPLGLLAKFGVQLMRELYGVLQQRRVQQLHLGIEWHGMPPNVPRMHSLHKCLKHRLRKLMRAIQREYAVMEMLPSSNPKLAYSHAPGY